MQDIIYTHTLKKLMKESSVASGLEIEDVGGSRGPSITSKVGTASSSSNSLARKKKINYNPKEWNRWGKQVNAAQIN